MSQSTVSPAKKVSTDNSRIGEQAPRQPLSGVKIVKESLSVNGLGHGAFLRQEEELPSRKKA